MSKDHSGRNRPRSGYKLRQVTRLVQTEDGVYVTHLACGHVLVDHYAIGRTARCDQCGDLERAAQADFERAAQAELERGIWAMGRLAFASITPAVGEALLQVLPGIPIPKRCR